MFLIFIYFLKLSPNITIFKGKELYSLTLVEEKYVKKKCKLGVIDFPQNEYFFDWNRLKYIYFYYSLCQLG